MIFSKQDAQSAESAEIDEQNILKKQYISRVNELYSRNKIPEVHLNSCISLFKDTLTLSNTQLLQTLSNTGSFTAGQLQLLEETVNNSELNKTMTEFGTMHRIKVVQNE